MFSLRVVHTSHRLADVDPLYERCWRVAVYRHEPNEFFGWDERIHATKKSAVQRAEHLSAANPDVFTLDY